MIKIYSLKMIKILSKLGIRGNLLNLIKTIYKRPTANIIDWKIFPKIRNKARMSTFLTSIQYVTKGSSWCKKSRKEIKVTQIGREVKLSLCADNMVVYIENPMKSIKSY